MIKAHQPAEVVIPNAAQASDCEALCNQHTQIARCKAAVTFQKAV